MKIFFTETMMVLSRMKNVQVLKSSWNLVRFRSTTAIPADSLFVDETIKDELASAKPYSEVPGPKPLPILGNTYRLLPVIGE